jgi:hypothetical protein
VTELAGTIAGTPSIDDGHMQAFRAGDGDLR